MTVRVIYACVFVCAHVSFLTCYFIFLHPNPGGFLLIFVVPWQQMERRSDRIRDRCERAVERPVHEEEELVAPRPRGRQNIDNRNHRQGHKQPQEDGIPNIEEVRKEGEEEVEQNIGNDPVQGEEPPAPPPTLAEMMDRQTWLLENLARRQDNGNGQGKNGSIYETSPTNL